MRRSRLPPLLALPLLLPALALANGAPFGGGAAPNGGLAPMDVSEVRLLSERLLLRVDDAGTALHARADYLLSNPGPPVQVRYGVPLLVEPDPEVDWDRMTVEDQAVKAKSEAAAQARSIRITLGERTTGCEIIDASPRKVEGGAGYFDVVCATPVTIPTGAEIPLRLEVDLQAILSGGSTSKSPYDWVGNAVFEWRLAPAGSWGGPVKSFEAVLEAGRWAGRVECSGLAAAERTDAGCTWRLADADFKAQKPIVVAVQTAAPRQHQQRMQSLVEQTVGLGVRASSTLAPQGKTRYDPANLLDGKVETAWCEGKKGPGVGEWVEVFEKPGPQEESPHCPLHGWVLSLGYVKDAKSWTRNARPTAVQVGPCGKGKGGVRFDLELPRFVDEASTVLEDHSGGFEFLEYRDGPACARLTVLEVAPGAADPDLCISEFRPVFNCN